jgi:hypothetical protein
LIGNRYAVKTGREILKSWRTLNVLKIDNIFLSKKYIGDIFYLPGLKNVDLEFTNMPWRRIFLSKEIGQMTADDFFIFFKILFLDKHISLDLRFSSNMFLDVLPLTIQDLRLKLWAADPNVNCWSGDHKIRPIRPTN